MRSLVAKLPAVVSKLLPPGLSDADIKQILDKDPDYFNDLCYDKVVQAMANVFFGEQQIVPLPQSHQ
eukprot:2980825-Karenia_brevis.AAC.1